jgi:hypothetical protein
MHVDGRAVLLCKCWQQIVLRFVQQFNKLFLNLVHPSPSPPRTVATVTQISYSGLVTTSRSCASTLLPQKTVNPAQQHRGGHERRTRTIAESYVWGWDFKKKHALS